MDKQNYMKRRGEKMPYTVYEIINREIEEVMKGGKKIVFFVGAGISLPSGSLDFKKLNREVIQTIVDDVLEEIDGKNPEEKKKDYESLEKIRPEVMYQIAIDELGSEILYSLEMLEGYEPSYYHYFLAEAIRRGNWVFTTNVDNLIEEACRRIKVNFKTYYGRGNDEDFTQYLQYINSGDIPGGCIFKLHGSIEEDANGLEKYKTIRFSLRQVGKGLFESRKRVLEYFLRKLDFWYIGYSCLDDFSVFPVLSGIRSEKDIFWCKHDEGPLSLCIPEEDRLLWEKEKEENKPLDEKRDLGSLNIIEVLLQRGRKFVIIGNLGEFINVKILPQLRVKIDEEKIREKIREKEKTKERGVFFRWAKTIGKFEKYLFLSRLFEQTGRLDMAIKCCEKSLKEAKNEEQQIRAKERMADLYYKRQEGDDEKNACNLYEQCINSSKDPLERARLKTSLSNVLRRRGKDFYSEAYNTAEEAKREFEKILGNERKKSLEYARCLNVHGLALYSLGKFEEARKSCLASLEIKKDLGDVDGEAESENAISLTFTQEGLKLLAQGKKEEAKAKEKFFKAIEHAEKALDCRRRVGNFRGYAPNCRNLAWPYSELMKLALNEDERKKYFEKARDGYKAGISYWSRLDPPPLIDSVLFRNLLARLYIDFCSITQDKKEKEKWAREVILLYIEMFKDPKKRQKAKEDPRKPAAKQNLIDAIQILKEIGLDTEAKDAEGILETVFAQ